MDTFRARPRSTVLRRLVVPSFIASALAASMPAFGQRTSPAVQTDAALVLMVLNDVKSIPKEFVPFSLSRDVPRKISVRLVSSRDRPGDFSGLIQEVRAGFPREIRSAIAQANDNAGTAAVTDDLGGILAVHGVRGFVHCGGADPDCIDVYPPGYSRNREIAVVRLFFSEILHPSLGVYVLKRQGRDWVIVAKKFETFV